MLVPLETLSGWPQVENPSPLQVLGLLVGIPLLIAIIVIALVEIGARARAGREDIIQASDPLWVGDQQRGVLEVSSENPGIEAADEVSAGDAEPALAHEHASAGDGNSEGDDAGEHVGGAGARW
jgi:hypothetical protein